LTYAVTNIVANALKYAPDSPITVDVTADEKNVYVSIADEGPGIPADTLPHIFDRFYRGSRRDVPGSGLGLAIAKVAVERAHGTLTAQSEAGKGTRFTIGLPRAMWTIAPSKAEVTLA
jgi:signal transduction histidine kinase